MIHVITDPGFRTLTALLWFRSHYRKRAAEAGVQTAARQLRKQGVPVSVAVALLATR